MKTTKENIETLLQEAILQKQNLRRQLDIQRNKWRVLHPESSMDKWFDIGWRAVIESICYVNGRISGYELALSCFCK